MLYFTFTALKESSEIYSRDACSKKIFVGTTVFFEIFAAVFYEIKFKKAVVIAISFYTTVVGTTIKR